MRKVLIITYYWPPSGGGGVQRWLKLSRYLPEEQWECIVCTPESPQFDQQDASLLDSVREETEVLRLPIWEPYKFLRLFNSKETRQQGITPSGGGAFARFVRGNILLPDPRLFWVRPAVRFLKDYLKDRPVDLIVTTGPPHSMHLIGRKLRKKTGIPWLADFRDPWSRWDMLDEFHTTTPARSIHRRLEKKVLDTADQIVTVSEPWANDFREMTQTPVAVIPNGFDLAEITAESRLPEKFRIVHFGLMNRFRDAPGLWEALDNLCRENAAFKNSLEVILGGMIEPALIHAIHSFSHLADRLKFEGTISHEQVLKRYQEAAVLLLLMNNTGNAAGHIPGKLFEYLASGRRILAIGDPAGASAQVIDRTNAGTTIDWSDARSCQEVLMHYFTDFRQGRLGGGVAQEIKKYSRENLAHEMAKLMERVVKDER